MILRGSEMDLAIAGFHIHLFPLGVTFAVLLCVAAILLVRRLL